MFHNLSFRKIIKVTGVVLLVALGGVYLFFRWHIDHMLGGNTDVVDTDQFESRKGKFAITHVNVLSVDAERMLPNQTVLIDGNKIASVLPASQVPEGYSILNAKGKYLIPGLIDSHVHLKKSRNDLLLYIANGVTQVGEMTGMDHHFDWQQEIARGAFGPGIYLASPKMTSQDSTNAKIRHIFETRHKSYTTEASARAAVRAFHQQGYQAIKISSDMSKNIYYAVNDEAKKLKIPVIGHVPIGLGLNDVYQSGQSQLAHTDSISDIVINEFGGMSHNNNKAFIEHLKSLAPEIAKQFKQRNIALASTVWLHQTRPHQDFDLAGFLKSIPYRYQNPGWVEGSLVSSGCLPGENAYQRYHPNEASKRAWEVYYQTYNQANMIIIQALANEGVTITAGTDALGACGMIPGFSLHQELLALKRFGLTNAQVLRSATIDAAKWMGINAGKISGGARADLVLLDKNPLKDLANTQSISAVIAKGVMYDRAQLDKMFQDIQAANANSRKRDISALL